MAKPPKKQEFEIKVPSVSDITQEQKEARTLLGTTVTIINPTEAVRILLGETNPTVAQTEETPNSIATEPLDDTEELGQLLAKVTEENKHPELIPTVEVDSLSVDDEITLKDAWGRSIPTTSLLIQSVNYTDLVSQVLYAAYLGGELDCSYRIFSMVPFRIRMLLPTEKYANWIAQDARMVYDETTAYNRVLVRGFDLYSFWKNLVQMGKNGAIVVPHHVAQRKPMYMVPTLTRAPVLDTPESRIGREKIKYTKEELDNFSLDELKIIGTWYNIPNMNAKKGYVKEVLTRQG